jgi:hypothetical protein
VQLLLNRIRVETVFELTLLAVSAELSCAGRVAVSQITFLLLYVTKINTSLLTLINNAHIIFPALVMRVSILPHFAYFDA